MKLSNLKVKQTKETTRDTEDESGIKVYQMFLMGEGDTKVSISSSHDIRKGFDIGQEVDVKLTNPQKKLGE